MERFAMFVSVCVYVCHGRGVTVGYARLRGDMGAMFCPSVGY